MEQMELILHLLMQAHLLILAKIQIAIQVQQDLEQEPTAIYQAYMLPVLEQRHQAQTVCQSVEMLVNIHADYEL